MMKVTNWALSLFAFMAALMMAVSMIAPLVDNGAVDDSVAAVLSEESGSSVVLGSGSGKGINISYCSISENDTKHADYTSYTGYALLVDLINPPRELFLSCELKDSAGELVYKSPTTHTPSSKNILFPTDELENGKYDVTISSNGPYSVSANLTVADDIKMYKISVNIIGDIGGTVSWPPAVNEGGKAFIIVTPHEGYAIGKVTLDEIILNPQSKPAEDGSVLYVIENVNKDCSVDVTFIPIGAKYHVKAVAGNGGQITPAGVELAKGETQIFTITPDAGYTLNDVKVNGISVSQQVIKNNDDGTFTYVYAHNIEGPQSIVASFKPYEPDKTYTINASAGNNGTIAPSGDVSVTSGESISFKVTPNSGYAVDSVLVDGKAVSLTGDTYKFLSVTDNHTISVTFKKSGGNPGPGPGPSSDYTINATAGSGGSISPQGSVSVSSGSSKTFKFTPNNGYEIDTLLVDGKTVQIIGDSFTFSNVTSNHTISVTFKKTGESTNYTISASAGSGGKITPSGKVSVVAGGSQTFTINADKGYEIDRVIVNGKEATVSESSYTFSNVNADQSISVTFKEVGTEPTPSEGDDGNNTMYYILIAIVIIIILVAAIYLFMRSKH